MHSGVFGIERIPIRKYPSTYELSRERTIFIHRKITQEHIINFHEIDFFVLIISKKVED